MLLYLNNYLKNTYNLSKNLQQNFVESIKGELSKKYHEKFLVPTSKVSNDSYVNAADNLDSHFTYDIDEGNKNFDVRTQFC